MSEIVASQHNSMSDAEVAKINLGRYLNKVRIQESSSGYGYNVWVDELEYKAKFGEPKTKIEP